jgi:hypothetical protein
MRQKQKTPPRQVEELFSFDFYVLFKNESRQIYSLKGKIQMKIVDKGGYFVKSRGEF